MRIIKASVITWLAGTTKIWRWSSFRQRFFCRGRQRLFVAHQIEEVGNKRTLPTLHLLNHKFSGIMIFLPTEQGPYRSHREGGQQKPSPPYKMPENLCFGTYKYKYFLLNVQVGAILYGCPQHF